MLASFLVIRSQIWQKQLGNIQKYDCSMSVKNHILVVIITADIGTTAPVSDCVISVLGGTNMAINMNRVYGPK